MKVIDIELTKEQVEQKTSVYNTEQTNTIFKQTNSTPIHKYDVRSKKNEITTDDNILSINDTELIQFNYFSNNLEIGIIRPKQIRTVASKKTKSTHTNDYLNQVWDIITENYLKYRSETFSISISHLVEQGIFNNERDAKRNLKVISLFLLDVKISRKDKKNKDSEDFNFSNAIMNAEAKGNIFSVSVNKQVFSEISKYYTSVPLWLKDLQNRYAYMLATYLFIYEREQRHKQKEYLTLTFDALAIYLGLPSPDSTHRHKEEIEDILNNAIACIIEKQKDELLQIEIKIVPFSNNGTIEDYLKNKLIFKIPEAITNYYLPYDDNEN